MTNKNILSTALFKRKSRPSKFNDYRELLDFLLLDEYILDQNEIADALEQTITNPEYRMAVARDRISRKFTDDLGNAESAAIKLREDFLVDLDIAGLFLSILSNTYINGVERTFFIDDKESKVLTDKMNFLYSTTGLAEAIATADMYSQVMNPIIYFQKASNNLFATVQLDYRYFIIEDFYDNKKIEYLVLAHEQPKNHYFTRNVSEDLNYANYTFEVFTKDKRIEVNRAGEVVREYTAGLDGEDMGKNPYSGMIPAYYLRDTINNQGLHRPVDSGLFNLNAEAMAMMPEVMISALTSAYGQWVFVSNSGKLKLAGSLGAFRALHAYNDSETSKIEAKNEKIEAQSADIIKVFDKLLSTYSVTKHLDPDLFVMEKSSSQRSGLAVKASQARLLQQTEARKNLRMTDEKYIFEMFKNIYNIVNPGDMIPENSRIEIKFKDSSIFTTELERINGIVSAFNNGLMDKLTAVSEINGVSKNQAEEIMNRIKVDQMEKIEMAAQAQVQSELLLNKTFGDDEMGDVQDGDINTEVLEGKRQPSTNNNSDKRKP